MAMLMYEQGPSTSQAHQQHPLPDASAAVDQLEKPGMPDAVINGGTSFIFHFATSLR